MNDKRPQTYLTTRPRVASMLISYGYTPHIEPHPWRPGLTAWRFESDGELEQLVLNYFTQADIRKRGYDNGGDHLEDPAHE